MLIIPAIDIMDGECVRLKKGNFLNKTQYPQAPVDQALAFEAAGADWLHVVDLDGAKTGKLKNLSKVRSMIKQTKLNIQFGGGLRDAAAIEKALKSGVERVVIGSLAVRKPILIKAFLLVKGTDRIVVALDVGPKLGNYYVVMEGWQKETSLLLDELITQFEKIGIVNFLITDISRDGMLKGPNFELYQTITAKFPKISVQASGGISSKRDLKRLEKTGVAAAIVGRAIYEGRLNIKGLFNVS